MYSIFNISGKYHHFFRSNLRDAEIFIVSFEAAFESIKKVINMSSGIYLLPVRANAELSSSGQLQANFSELCIKIQNSSIARNIRINVC